MYHYLNSYVKTAISLLSGLLMELLYKANIWPNIEMRMYYLIEKKFKFGIG